MNALKSGIHAESLVLPTEDPDALVQLTEDYYQHHRPTNPQARAFVDDLIRCEWTLRRLDRAETQMWLYQNENKYSDPETYPLGRSATSYAAAFSRMQYRQDATRRARQRALQSLKDLPAPGAAESAPAPLIVVPDRPSLPPSPQTTSPQIGFVPPNPPATPAAPPPPPPVPAIDLPGDLTRRGIMNLDGVLQPAPAGFRSFESFRGTR